MRISLQAGVPSVSVDGGSYGSLAGGQQAAEAAIAQSLIGAGAQGLLPYFHATAILGDNGHTVQKIVSGASATAAGAWTVSTGASASSAYQALAGAGTGFFATPFRTGQPWSISARFAVTTAITAQTRAGVTAFDTTGGVTDLQLGVVGSVSTGFFVLNASAGSPIITTIPIDTSMHTFRAWRVGGATFVQIDGGTIFTGTADISTTCGPAIQIGNGTDAVNRAMNVVWYAGACQAL